MDLLKLEKRWGQFHQICPILAIRNSQDHDRMLLIADQISDALCSSSNESLLSLYDLVCELIHSYELEHA